MEKFEDMVNWELFSKVKENPSRFFRILEKVVEEAPEPWAQKPRPKGGRLPYKSKDLIKICMLKIYFNKSFRGVEFQIREDESLRSILGLTKVPDRNTIQRAMKKLDMDYFKKLNDQVFFHLKRV